MFDTSVDRVNVLDTPPELTDTCNLARSTLSFDNTNLEFAT